MKGCLKFFAIAAAVIVGGFVLLAVLGIGAGAWTYSKLTPEQKAASQKAAVERMEKDRQEAEAEEALKAEAKAMRDQIIAEERPKFLEWLTTEGQCLRAQFTSDNSLKVELPRLLIPTKDDARVRGEEIAERWAVRAGWDRVAVSVYYGNEVYAEGIYAGGVPKLYLLKTQAMKAAKDRAALGLPNAEGWTWHEITRKHGAPLSQDLSSGWAVWKTFKARISEGKVQEITTP